MPRAGSSRFYWADLAVVPLIAVLSLPPLLWFGHHWLVGGNDTARYLLAGSRLVSGGVIENLDTISDFNGGHGPGLPAVVGMFILVFGRDTAALVWGLRLISLLNPLLAYLLVRRISTPVAGLIAAALVSLLAFNVESPVAINIDGLLLTFYLLSLLALMAAVTRGGTLLAVLSGVLLGVAILTKESAIVDVPLALLAVLLLDWDLRGAVWHYLGVSLVCLPWWIWAYLAVGEVYLVGALPAGLRIPMLVTLGTLLVLTVAAYAYGMIDRFLADRRRRLWIGLFVTVAWTVSLSGALLATTASHALDNFSFETSRAFLAELLAPVTIVVPTLVAVVWYTGYKAFRGEGAWRLVALAMLFQAPVCLLLTVQLWAPRQFLVPQALVLCVLGALVVAAFSAAWQGRGPYRIAVAVGAAVLVVVLLASSLQTVRAMVLDNLDGGFARQKSVLPPAERMVDWMDENVPAGERILIVAQPAMNLPESDYLRYLDGGRHEWTTLRLDQTICVPRPNVQIGCDPDQDAISRIPPDALWVQKSSGACGVISLSRHNLLEQSRRSDADYVAIYGGRRFPAVLSLPPALRASGAYDLAHADVYVKGKSGKKQGVALLKSTGETPGALPTRMNEETALMLRSCEQAYGPGYEKMLRSKFPNGVTGARGAFKPLAESPTQ